MKRTTRPVFIFISLFCLIGCANNSNLIRDNGTVQREYRFYEETGGFSLVVPVTWKTIDLPPSKYKAIGLPREEGLAAVGFSIDTFDGPLDVMIDALIEGWHNLHTDFELLQRDVFFTNNKLKGEKFTISNTMYDQRMRQTIYCFPGKNNSSILIFCTTRAERGDFYDKRFDHYVRTFEWTAESVGKQESKRFVEEKGGFSLNPHGPYEVIDAPGASEYKVIKMFDENGILHIVTFTMIYTDYDLKTLVDKTVEYEYLNRSFNSTLLQRSDFVTSKNGKGEKLIYNITNDDGQSFEHSIYIIQGEGRKIISISCTSPIQAADIFYERFEKMVKSFEWID